MVGDKTLIHQTTSKTITINAPDAKILVVDDNTINLNVACGLLQLCKINPETADSGMQAIEMVRHAEAGQNQYDLIFMDHMMPEMDGVEATKIIRAMEKEQLEKNQRYNRDLRKQIPIIALTANAISGVKEEFLAAGMNDLLTKPIDKVLLNEILKNWLPVEKVIEISAETITEESGTETNNKFWKKIEQIEGLSAETGLDRVSGQREIYEKSLQLAIREIEKCDNNSNAFLAANDMRNFSIEAHSMKGTLANIGAMELSEEASALETAANKEDMPFCAAALPSFLEKLTALKVSLGNAFAEKHPANDKLEITRELLAALSAIFDKLTTALDTSDFVTIDNCIEELADLNPGGTLQEEIEKIKDAVLVMDYEGANKVMEKLKSVT
jgi:CheY-like chemotaxis protein